MCIVLGLPGLLLFYALCLVSTAVLSFGVWQSIQLLKIGTWETVPYTNRIHLVLPRCGVSEEKQKKEEQVYLLQLIHGIFRGQLLPASHPDSLRVRAIAQNIIVAFIRDTMAAGDQEKLEKKKAWSRLSGQKWGVYMVDHAGLFACLAPGGKIVVSTGTLEIFKTDAEIATVIAHEFAHAVADHAAERRVKNWWARRVRNVLSFLVKRPEIADEVSKFLWHPLLFRMMEKEADYIALMLMASAGYDPRVASGVYEKTDETDQRSRMTWSSWRQLSRSTHPSGKERARLLARAHVMEEALAKYNTVRKYLESKMCTSV